MTQDRIKLIVALLFLLALTLPFICKAFHIDDYPVILASEHVVAHPFNPYGGEIADFGKTMALFDAFRYPPLIPFYVGVIRFIPWRSEEVRLHLAFLIFPAILAISMYLLACRFTRYPLAATVLLIATPGFLVSSHSIMTDVPMTAFFFLALSCYVYGVDRRSDRLIMIAGVFTALAWLARYRALPILLMLQFLYSVFQKRIRLKDSVLAGLLPLVLFLAWETGSVVRHGTFHSLASFSALFREQVELISMGISHLSFLGGSVLFSVFFLWLWRKDSVLRWGLLFLLPVAYCCTLFVPEYSVVHTSLFFIFILSGCSMVLIMGRLLLRSLRQEDHDSFFIVLCFFIQVLVVLFFAKFGCVRNLLIMFPFLIIGLMKNVEAMSSPARSVCAVLSGSVLLSLLVSLFVAVGDYEYAGVYRDCARRLAEKYGDTEVPVYYTGQWGFRYYMDKEGYSYLLSDQDELEQGALVVVPALPAPQPLHPDVQQQMIIREHIEIPARLPVRVMSRTAHAGFYSDGWGKLPFSFSRSEPLEVFEVYTLQ